MNPIIIAILLFSVGLLLLSAELVIPAHGVTAGLGLLSLLCGVIACFAAGEWIGVGVLAAGAIVGPVAAAGWMQLLTRSRAASRIILPPMASLRPEDKEKAVATAEVSVGQVGVTVSALRPSGVCEFVDAWEENGPRNQAMIRVQAISEFGPLPPGCAVRVLAVTDGRATVREA